MACQQCHHLMLGVLDGDDGTKRAPHRPKPGVTSPVTTECACYAEGYRAGASGSITVADTMEWPGSLCTTCEWAYQFPEGVG